MPERNITLSIVSHGQNALVNPLLDDVQRRRADRVALVLTENIPDPTPLATGTPFHCDADPTTPRHRGLLTAMQDLGLKKAHVVCPVRERFTLAAGVEALPVEELPRMLGAAKPRLNRAQATVRPVSS